MTDFITVIAQVAMTKMVEPKSIIDYAKWLSLLVALVVALFGAGFFYNQIWLNKVLAYSLPSDNVPLNDGTFSTGITVENRGRAPLTDIQITAADLGEPLLGISFWGVHESADIVSGGAGYDGFMVTMPRLSVGSKISIYLASNNPIPLSDHTFLITSAETAGVFYTEDGKAVPKITYGNNWVRTYLINAFGFLIVSLILVFAISEQPRKRISDYLKKK